MTTTDPRHLLDTLTTQLTDAGWTREPDPAPAPGITGATLRLLTSPDGDTQVHATAYRTSQELATTLCSLRHHKGYRGIWYADTAALSASVLIAAARAATEPPATGVEPRLREAGWEVTDEQYEGPRLLEQTWSSPDRTRSANWFPPDLPFDEGGWILTRPDQHNRRAQIDTSSETPDAVTAALALTD